MLVMASILFWFDSSLISSVTFQRTNDINKDKFNKNKFTDLLTTSCLPQSILLWLTLEDYFYLSKGNLYAWKTVPMAKNLKPIHFWCISLLKHGNNKKRKQITIIRGVSWNENTSPFKKNLCARVVILMEIKVLYEM